MHTLVRPDISGTYAKITSNLCQQISVQICHTPSAVLAVELERLLCIPLPAASPDEYPEVLLAGFDELGLHLVVQDPYSRPKVSRADKRVYGPQEVRRTGSENKNIKPVTSLSVFWTLEPAFKAGASTSLLALTTYLSVSAIFFWNSSSSSWSSRSRSRSCSWTNKLSKDSVPKESGFWLGSIELSAELRSVFSLEAFAKIPLKEDLEEDRVLKILGLNRRAVIKLMVDERLFIV